MHGLYLSRELIQTWESLSAMIFSCIDLVMAALVVGVKGYLLAHTFAAQMGTVRFSLFYSLRVFFFTIFQKQ